jgi:hypothetical protein
MANKKPNTKKKTSRPAPTAKKKTQVKKTALKKTAKPAKKSQKKTTPNKTAKKPAKKAASKKKSSLRKKPQGKESADFLTRQTTPLPVYGGQSGDTQGLSVSENADSESVDELVEEGNALEAGVIAGVEDADDHDEQEVHTHEVPEDDVPEEYLEDE